MPLPPDPTTAPCPDGGDRAAPLQVAIYNDYDIVVRGLVAVLAESPLDAVVVSSAERSTADIILVDTQGHVDGWGLVDDLLGSDTPVAVFSWQAPSPRYHDFIDAGLVGYIPKSADAAEVVRALQTLAAGGTVHPGRDDLDQSIGAWPGQEQGLTARESEIVAFILQGLSNDQIAAASFLSVNTVKSHVRTAYRKMGTTTRAQAIGWGLARGFDRRPETRPPAGS